jgi:hypothetical protein
VQAAAMRALAGEGAFRDLLRQVPEVAAAIPAAEWDGLFAWEPYFQHVGTIFRRLGLDGETDGPGPSGEGRGA